MEKSLGLVENGQIIILHPKQHLGSIISEAYLEGMQVPHNNPPIDFSKYTNQLLIFTTQTGSLDNPVYEFKIKEQFKSVSPKLIKAIKEVTH